MSDRPSSGAHHQGDRPPIDADAPARQEQSATPISLLERVRRPNDRAAWERFIELYTPLLFHWVRRLGLSEADAADLVQEVLLILVRTLPSFSYDPGQGFRRWLRTVTLNKWRERLRRQAAQLETQAAGKLADRLAAPEDEAIWEAEYRQRLVARALRIMQRDFQPATWRACWEHVACGRPAPEVAAELGMSVGAVYAATGRVLARLRQELHGLLD
jgi:RNA polymerase sigma-70 factor (ECF subfamily)